MSAIEKNSTLEMLKVLLQYLLDGKKLDVILSTIKTTKLDTSKIIIPVDFRNISQRKLPLHLDDIDTKNAYKTEKERNATIQLTSECSASLTEDTEVNADTLVLEDKLNESEADDLPNTVLLDSYTGNIVNVSRMASYNHDNVDSNSLNCDGTKERHTNEQNKQTPPGSCSLSNNPLLSNLLDFSGSTTSEVHEHVECMSSCNTTSDTCNINVLLKKEKFTTTPENNPTAASARKKRKKREPGDPKFAKDECTCTECGKILSSPSCLSVHMRRHTGSRPFHCSLCDKGFTTRANRERHEQAHRGEKPYKCPECGRNFLEKKTMVEHRRCHTGEKPYQCDDCGKCFAQRNTINAHRYLHTKERPHICEFCGARFIQKQQLRTHQLRHENSRRYKCDSCDKAFVCQSDVNRHKARMHGEHQCDVCNASLSSKTALRKHTREHTQLCGVSKEYTCQLCMVTFYNQQMLDQHSKLCHATVDDQVKSVQLNDLRLPTAQNSEPTYIIEEKVFDNYTTSNNSKHKNALQMSPDIISFAVKTEVQDTGQTISTVELIDISNIILESVKS